MKTLYITLFQVRSRIFLLPSFQPSVFYRFLFLSSFFSRYSSMFFSASSSCLPTFPPDIWYEGVMSLMNPVGGTPSYHRHSSLAFSCFCTSLSGS